VPFLGKTPTVGNFILLDAITVSNTATFALTKDTVDYYPGSAQNMIVSVNGVTQAPLTAYTITDNNIIFSSALDSDTDVIDYILVLGDTLNIGRPSDSTVGATQLQDYAVTSVKMSNTGVGAATYGTSTSIPQITIDAAGRITSATGIDRSNQFEDLTVTGNLTVSGNTVTVDAQTLDVDDPLIHLASNNDTTDVVDIGFVGNYSNDGSTVLNTGFFRDASDEQYYLFNGLEGDLSSATTVDRAANTFTLADLNVSRLIATTESTRDILKLDAGSNVDGWLEITADNITGRLRAFSNAYSISFLQNSVSLETAEDLSLIAYSSDSNIKFHTGGFPGGGGQSYERMRINSDGLVGIGIDPVHELDILANGGATLRVANETDSTAKLILRNVGSSDGSIYQTGGNMSFDIGASEAMRIDTNRDVGIGSSNPVARLSVNAADGPNATYGIANFTTPAGNDAYITINRGAADLGGIKILRGSNADMSMYVTGAETAVIHYNGGDTGDVLLFREGSANTERMRIDNSGKVGIGRTPTDVGLEVFGPAYTGFDGPASIFIYGDANYNDAGNAGSGILFGGEYTSAGSQTTFALISGIKENINNTDYAGALTFQTRPAGGTPLERMRINSTGAVSIGANTGITIGTGNGETIFRAWNNATDTDVDGLLSGSAFGSIIESGPNGHMVIGLRENDVGDTFSIVTGGGNYMTDTTYDTVAMSMSPTGATTFAESAQAGGTAGNGTRGGNLIARVPGGANGNDSGVMFWGTFTNYPADQGPRRVADITAGYSTGTWGTEFMSLRVGGAGDAANITTERVNISSKGVLERGTDYGSTGRLIGSKTISSSGTWVDIARVGHTATVHCKGLLTNSGGGGSSGNAAAQVIINVLYGNSQTEVSHQHYSPSAGNITNLEFRYLNTGGSTSYIIQARGTFTATNPKLHFVLDGVFGDAEPYLI
jgi:hypothetical protein